VKCEEGSLEELFFKIPLAAFSLVLFYKLFVRQIWQLIRDDINLNRAKKELPLLAKELKLSHRKGDYFGSYHGRWNNHAIRIEPNNFHTSIGIKTTGNPRFSAVHEGIAESKFDILYLFHPLKKLIIGLIPDYPAEKNDNPRFDFENRLLDNYFQDRRILDHGGQKNARHPGLQNAMAQFIGKNAKIVRNLSIGQEVSCSLWRGSATFKSRLFSVTAAQARRMLAEMLPIVEELDRTV